MRTSVLSIAFLFVAAAHTGHARTLAGKDQSPVDSVGVHSIDEVSVYGSRPVAGDVVPAQVLAGEALRRLSVVSVADAIRYFSGAQIKDYGGIGGLKTVNVRSMGTQHVGVFYDGVQLGNAQNGVVDLGRFSMDNMEAVSLYNGQKSNIFQSAKDYASSAAVYMTSRRPIFEGEKKHNLRLGLSGGSFGTVNPSALWETRLGPGVDAQLSAEWLYTTGRYRFSYRKAGGYDTTEVRRNGDVRALRLEGGLFGRLPRGDWRAKVYIYDSERGYPGASVREEPGRFRHEDRQWDTNIFAQGSVRQYFGRYSLMINAKYAQDALHYQSDPRLDVTTMWVDNRYHQREGYLSAVNGLALTRAWRLGLSTDVQYNTLDADLVDFAHPRRLVALTAAATSLEISRLDLQASLLHSYIHDTVQGGGAGAADDKNHWTPTLVASWQILRRAAGTNGSDRATRTAGTDLTLRAFYKRIFRMPTLNDLYYTFIGNKYLDPERTEQYNLGATYSHTPRNGRLRKIELQLDGYFNRVRDKIIAMPASNQFAWTTINLGYVEIRGLDAAVQTDVDLGGHTGLTTRLTYTFQRAQDLTDPADEWHGGQIPYIPRHSGSAVVGLDHGGWSFNYSFIYTGERYESRANTAENYAQPWYTSDVSLSREAGRWRLTAEVNNIFNQQYEVVQCYPMPGVNVKLKITWTL